MLEVGADGLGRLETIEPERTPVRPVDVPCHQVPARPAADQTKGFDQTVGRFTAPVGVGEASPFMHRAGVGQDQEVGSFDPVRSGPRPQQRRCALVQVAYSPGQVGREEMVQLGQRGDGGLLETGDGAVDRRPQTDGDGDGFVIVEQ